MNTFRKSLVKVVALPVLSVLCSLVQAAPCNTVTSKTILPPDGMAVANQAPTVFVTLNQILPSGALASCKVSFNTPTVQPYWNVTQKCDALVNAITNPVPGKPATNCLAQGFSVSNNSCALTRTFQVTGTGATNPPVTTPVTLSISNAGFDLNEDNKGKPLPNYEEEIITPGCLAAAGGLGTEPQGLLATKGTATGVSFVAGQPAAVQVVVDQSNNGGAITTARVDTTTTPGMTAATIVSQLNTQLEQAGVSCSVVPNSQFPFPAILCTQPSTGFANGFGISTSDTGIGVGNASGPANTIMNAFNGPVTDNGDIPLPLPALVVLASLLAGSGIVVGRRKRK